ncbi:SHOCT domain-containing protein [Haloarchaeobius iranensis]|uniref:Short C-terminal domain-containing protein n=1 Tax=Haloarchaeobius iranensis TaxID=996166 RepID=A0A1G9T949_9EURY|nr:SHOCT domain-containing protein [Haloarchaeobius iranensis]SDM44148.1 Short C-terminal domain-containing protein [Haloarchaeobius iranensis]
MTPGDDSDSQGTASAITSLLVLGAGLLGLFLGVPNWWLIFVIGYAVVLPIVATLFDEDDDGEVLDEAGRGREDALNGRTDERVPDSKRDALETLRERYAQGELSEEQFENKLENLLETETLEDARARIDRSATGEARPADDRELERE